jgi:hypothetical protein
LFLTRTPIIAAKRQNLTEFLEAAPEEKINLPLHVTQTTFKRALESRLLKNAKS